VAERPGAATPIPNRADAAWERLQALRAEARELGIEITEREPIVELEQLIKARRQP
jgi:hypothetical protein